MSANLAVRSGSVLKETASYVTEDLRAESCLQDQNLPPTLRVGEPNTSATARQILYHIFKVLVTFVANTRTAHRDEGC